MMMMLIDGCFGVVLLFWLEDGEAGEVLFLSLTRSGKLDANRDGKEGEGERAKRGGSRAGALGFKRREGAERKKEAMIGLGLGRCSAVPCGAGLGLINVLRQTMLPDLVGPAGR